MGVEQQLFHLIDIVEGIQLTLLFSYNIINARILQFFNKLRNCSSRIKCTAKECIFIFCFYVRTCGNLCHDVFTVPVKTKCNRHKCNVVELFGILPNIWTICLPRSGDKLIRPYPAC